MYYVSFLKIIKFKITNIDNLFFLENIIYFINFTLLENNYVILKIVWD